MEAKRETVPRGARRALKEVLGRVEINSLKLETVDEGVEGYRFNCARGT